MSESTDFCLVLSTTPDGPTARKLAEGLVAANLAGCVNIVPGLVSVYPWKGKVETAEECLLIIKTRRPGFDAVRDYLLARHPYELPEIIAVPIVTGLPEYLAWIDTCLKDRSDI